MKEGPARQVDSEIRNTQDQRKHTRGHLSDLEGSISQAQSFAVVSDKPETHRRVVDWGPAVEGVRIRGNYSF